MKWGWLFRTYVQWHAIAFLLSELCVRTKGEAVERAWRALEATAGRWWFPLNNASPHRKGQQGCLWKPLRKLLAKAKAARERELALERASIALRNGQMMYPGYPLRDDRTNLTPLSVDQPSSENLDRMLRPAAPRLGDSATSSQPSWPNSPSTSNGQGPFPRRLADITPVSQQQSGVDMHGASATRGSPADAFADLTKFGLDSVLGDVMHGIDVTGHSIPDYSHPLSGGTASNVPNSTQTMPPRMQSTARTVLSATMCSQTWTSAT
jgi:hypothetical protein